MSMILLVYDGLSFQKHTSSHLYLSVGIRTMTVSA